MWLASGTFWPMPIPLDSTVDFTAMLRAGSSKVALRNAVGVMLAVLYIEEVW
jgi:ATP sulfurylase